MNLQDGNTAVQIRQLHRDTPVETARTQQCGIQGFRTVGCGQDQDAVVAGKAIHFREQLIQSLFPLVIA